MSGKVYKVRKRFIRHLTQWQKNKVMSVLEELIKSDEYKAFKLKFQTLLLEKLLINLF